MIDRYAEGYRAGIEAAAKVCDELEDYLWNYGSPNARTAVQDVSARIRALPAAQVPVPSSEGERLASLLEKRAESLKPSNMAVNPAFYYIPISTKELPEFIAALRGAGGE